MKNSSFLPYISRPPLKNFDIVEQKIVEVEQKDHIRNFQPPVTGDEIMMIFQLPP